MTKDFTKTISWLKTKIFKKIKYFTKTISLLKTTIFNMTKDFTELYP